MSHSQRTKTGTNKEKKYKYRSTNQYSPLDFKKKKLTLDIEGTIKCETKANRIKTKRYKNLHALNKHLITEKKKDLLTMKEYCGHYIY